MSFICCDDVLKNGSDSVLNEVFAGNNMHYIAIGLKETLRAIEAGYALKVFVCDDADESVVKQVSGVSNLVHLPCKQVLGEYLGIAVSCAVACILSKEHCTELRMRHKTKKNFRERLTCELRK